MLKGNDDTKIITPFNEDTPVEFMFSSKGFDVNLLPKNKLIKYQPQIGSAYKFYYLEKIKKGEFSLAYGDGSLLKFSYDKDKLPYLGIWLNNGEFQNLYSITPEPCTAPFDSPNRAKKRGYSSIIDKNSELNFKISISLKE